VCVDEFRGMLAPNARYGFVEPFPCNNIVAPEENLGEPEDRSTANNLPKTLSPLQVNSGIEDDMAHESGGVLPLAERQLLRTLRRYVINGDGNCVFRACAHQMYGNEEKHIEVRDNVVRFMDINQSIFGPAVEGKWHRYLDNQRQDKTWGGKSLKHSTVYEYL
jgi:hypothetical protein